MRWFGLILVGILLVLPAPSFWTLADQHDASALFSQYIGSVALIAMGIVQLLATRWVGLETVFGGLDRIYVLHKWLGIAAISCVLLHDTIDAEMRTTGPETLLSDFAETLGEISLYGLLVLVVLTLATFVPYHLWRYTHKFMGAFFAASAAHYIWILRPFDLADPVGLYILFFCLLGIVCYVYTLMPWGLFQGRNYYEVDAVSRTNNCATIDLKPKQKGIRHRAGQFAFVSFSADGLNEVHPYTISRAPKTGDLQFTIKALGGYTHDLIDTLKPGVTARVSKAFGDFHLRKHDGVDIWVAGGIGITPFKAFAETLTENSPKTHLFYAVKSRQDAVHFSLLEQKAAELENFSVHLVESTIRGRLTADQLCEITGERAENVRVYFCGPEAMRKSLQKRFAELGLRAAHFYYEEFEIRSGIGVRNFAGYLLKKFGSTSGTGPMSQKKAT